MARETKTREAKGRGWHGDPKGHAEAGRKGGQASSGKFQEGSERAREAGRDY